MCIWWCYEGYTISLKSIYYVNVMYGTKNNAIKVKGKVEVDLNCRNWMHLAQVSAGNRLIDRLVPWIKGFESFPQTQIC